MHKKEAVMKKTGILAIAILILAVTGIFLYQMQKKDTEAPIRQEQGTLVKEFTSGRNIIYKN